MFYGVFNFEGILHRAQFEMNEMLLIAMTYIHYDFYCCFDALFLFIVVDWLWFDLSCCRKSYIHIQKQHFSTVT